MVNKSNCFAKAICPICYEDLSPLVEDLQVVSICGHVFHELCLQQWFEYSANAKKCTCPVCKQSCSSGDVARLYFQSIGNQDEHLVPRKTIDSVEEEEDLVFLRGQVRKLEAKASGISSVLEDQGKEIKQLNEELYLCRDQLKKEVILRNDAEQQKASVQWLLCSKSEEIDTLKLESLKLQDRNMALAKELAALKLVSDLNLEEDEILKLASFCNEANNKDTIDILRKSLVIRNKSYKELMGKCNELGRGEARSCKRLEKAKEKIHKLKTRVQELEMVVEIKDNEGLRALSASKKISCREVTLNDANESNGLSTNTFQSKDQKQQYFFPADHLTKTGSSTRDQECIIQNEMCSTSAKEFKSAPSKQKNTCIAINGVASELSKAVHLDSVPDSKPLNWHLNSALTNSEALSDIKGIHKVLGLANSSGLYGKADTPSPSKSEEVILLHDDIRQGQPMLNIQMESPCLIPPSNPAAPGNLCFSGGLLGPDGTNRYLGKWCKRMQNKGSVGTQQISSSSGDLIAVGSDGKGGRIKILRSPNQSSLDNKENLVAAKRCKYGGKAGSSLPQGCLQIEHFFGRAGD